MANIFTKFSQTFWVYLFFQEESKCVSHFLKIVSRLKAHQRWPCAPIGNPCVVKLYAQRHWFYVQHCFQKNIWRPSWCPNWVEDSSLEILSSLLPKTSWIFQFGVHLPWQTSNLPRLFKMCKMRLPKWRVLLQSTFEGLTELPIELMIAHWKSLCV